ncbi:MAG: tetratricopeptide repeat protein [Acidobacteriota bacterium]
MTEHRDDMRWQESERATARQGAGGPASDQRPELRETLPSAENGPITPPAPIHGRSPSSTTFSPGDLVANRYTIIRLIGLGGMGEVYEAQDKELGVRVALKAVRAEIAERPGAIDRFKREVDLARRVTHPNVCRIFDIGHHADPRGKTGITFMTMGLLAGETLENRIRRAGRMTTAEALPLIRQMCAALEAAHEAGITHRDFKPGNVAIVPIKEGSAEVRVVVTDFGLARSSVMADRTGAAITGTGEIIGTPAYMAPEQVEGGAITESVDIYALGIVIYEMLTGALPFEGDTALSLAVKRLKEPPRSPRAHVPDLDRRWEEIILRCLERAPSDRFAGAMDVAQALAGEQLASSPRQKRRLRDLTLAGVAIAALIVIIIILIPPHERLPAPAAPQSQTIVKPRPAVAILGFKNLTGNQNAAWLSTALSDMLGTELAASEKLRTIPGENVARMKVDLSIREIDSFARETIARIRSNLAADFVISGSYAALGEKSGGLLRLDIILQDASSGDTVAAIPLTGNEAGLFDLVSQVGTQLRSKLGAGQLTAAQVDSLHATLPASSEVTRLYAEGVSKLRSFDALSARAPLERAVKADPNYCLAHSALAQAWTRLGYDEKAKQESKLAMDLSAALPREERLLVEGQYRTANREWEKGVEIYRTLWTFFPDNLEYGLLLAGAQTSAGKGKDALQTVTSLHTLPPPASDDPRIDLQEARTAREISDFRRQRDASARAVANGSRQGATLLVASARLEEGWALKALGDVPKAMEAFRAAREAFSAAGDRGGVARATSHMGATLLERGDLAGAASAYGEALAVYREIGDRSGEGNVLRNLASIASGRGDIPAAERLLGESLTVARETANKSQVATVLNDLANIDLDYHGDIGRAKKRYQEALAAYREIGDRSSESMAMHNLAVASQQEGDLLTAKKLYEEAMAIATDNGEKGFAGAMMHNLAGMLYLQGDLVGARKRFEESITLMRDFGFARYVPNALHDLGRVLLEQGDLVNARKRYEEALKIRMENGQNLKIAETRAAISRLLLEEGRPLDAEALARETIAAMCKENLSEWEAPADTALAEALLAQGKLAAADAAVRSARTAEHSDEVISDVDTTTVEARLRATEGKTKEALEDLDRALAKADKVGTVPSQLWCRLALGEIQITHGDRAAGRKLLQALEKDAKAKGFLLIAGKANAALK